MGFRSLLGLPLVALVAACGSTEVVTHGGADRAQPTEPNRASFVAEAKAVCTAPRKTTASSGWNGHGSDGDLRAAIDAWADVVRELRALEPPAGETRRVDRMLTHFENAIRAGRVLGSTNDETALAAFAAVIDQGQQGAEIAQSYGLEICSPIPAAPAGVGAEAALREQVPTALLDPDGKPLKPRVAPPSPAVRMRRLASSLVPPGRAVFRQQDCSGGDPASRACVTIELAPIDRPVVARRAEIAELAARGGWTQLRPTGGKWPVGLVVLHRDDYEATVWLGQPACTPSVQVGDGPQAKASARRCVDTIMVTAPR